MIIKSSISSLKKDSQLIRQYKTIKKILTMKMLTQKIKKKPQLTLLFKLLSLDRSNRSNTNISQSNLYLLTVAFRLEIQQLNLCILERNLQLQLINGQQKEALCLSVKREAIYKCTFQLLNHSLNKWKLQFNRRQERVLLKYNHVRFSRSRTLKEDIFREIILILLV